MLDVVRADETGAADLTGETGGGADTRADALRADVTGINKDCSSLATVYYDGSNALQFSVDFSDAQPPISSYCVGDRAVLVLLDGPGGAVSFGCSGGGTLSVAAPGSGGPQTCAEQLATPGGNCLPLLPCQTGSSFSPTVATPSQLFVLSRASGEGNEVTITVGPP